MYIPEKIKRKLWQGYILVLLVVAILIWTSVAQAPDQLVHLHVLDVGQGDAIYVQLPDGQDILIDGGPNDKVLTELAEVMPFSDRTIDLVIASHNHSDHIRGLIKVLQKFEVKEIWLPGAIHTTNTYAEWIEAVKEEEVSGATVVKPRAGDERAFGDLALLTLFPLQDLEGTLPNDQHDGTIVVRVSFGEVDILLTGDLNEGHEAEMLQVSAESLPSEILKVPHHGSATGLSYEFLETVSPGLAIISVGANNRYGHPTASILRKLNERQVETLRTDEHGRIEVVSDGKTFWTNAEN